MNAYPPLLKLTRRRFVGLLAALGVTLPWPSWGRGSSQRLSSHEAAFYRRGDDSRK